MDSYVQLVDRIARSSGLEKGEIEKRVEAKRAKLSGLVSKEGAAQIVAAELGINFDQERMKISEVSEGQKRVNTLGKVIKLNPVRSYNKNGKEGKVASMTIGDETGNVRLVFWDTNHISLVETEKIKEGSVIELSNGNVRNGEIHLSSFGDVKVSKEKLDTIIVEKQFSSGKLKDAKPGDGMKTRAFIVHAYEPRYFEVCPECGKRALENECKTHGKVTPVKRALLSIVLDDGTETMRSVLFGDQILKLGLTNEQIFSLDEYNLVKSKFLGEEKIFSGNVRTNQLFNSTEFTIEGIEEVNPTQLIEQLESKA